MRFEGLPGEFSQHDFGHVDVRFLDGTQKRIHFFASRLKYSRWVEVTIVPERASRDARPHARRSLRGHRRYSAPRGLRSAQDGRARSGTRMATVTEWNPIFASVALDLGLGIEVCWPSAPQQKGAVENLVGWVKGSFFKQRRFLDDAICSRSSPTGSSR